MDFNTRCNLGVLLKTKGDLTGAEAEYRAALQIDPTDVDTRCNLGILLMDMAT